MQGQPGARATSARHLKCGTNSYVGGLFLRGWFCLGGWVSGMRRSVWQRCLSGVDRLLCVRHSCYFGKMSIVLCDSFGLKKGSAG